MAETREAGVRSGGARQQVEWKRYETPESLARVFFSSMGVLPDDVEIEGVDMDGAGYPGINFETFMGGIKVQGQWGYLHCEDGQAPVVHYWHDGKRSAVEIARMLGHELGHLHEPGGPEAQDDEPGACDLEMAADEYGDVAGQVVARLLSDGALADPRWQAVAEPIPIDGPFISSFAFCRSCGHRWVSVRPTRADDQKLECPACHAQDSATIVDEEPAHG